MTFGLWNKKSSRGESKPSVAAVAKSKWSKLKGKLSPRRDQQLPDTRAPQHTQNSPEVSTTEEYLQYPRGESKPSVAPVAKTKWSWLKGKPSPPRDQQLPDTKNPHNTYHFSEDRPRKPQSGEFSLFESTALPTPSVGWSSRLRDEAGFGLPQSKPSSKTKVDDPPISRPLSSESWSEWDPEFYASTMEAERREVAGRINPTATPKRAEPRRAEVRNGSSNVVLPPLPPPMTRTTRDVVEGARSTSASPPVPLYAPKIRDASSKLVVALPKDVGSGHSGHRQASPRFSGTVSTIPPGEAATARDTGDQRNPLPIIMVEEPTPETVRVKSYQYLYRPPTARALESSIGARRGEEPRAAIVRAEPPEVLLPLLPPPLPRNPYNANKTAKRRPPLCTRIPRNFHVVPNPSDAKIEGAQPTGLHPAPSPRNKTKPSGPLEREDVGNDRNGSTSNPTARALESRNAAREGDSPGAAIARAESLEVVLPPLPPPLWQKSYDAHAADRTPARRPVHRRTRQALNVSPRLVVGKIEEAQPTDSRPTPYPILKTNPSGSLHGEDVSVTPLALQTAVHLPSGKDGRNKASGESRDSDADYNTPRASVIGLPSESGESEENAKTSRASRISLTSESGDSEDSDATLRASRINPPSEFAAARVQQAIQNRQPLARGIGRNDTSTVTNRPSTERTRQPTTLPREPQPPQIPLTYRTPQASETEIRGRESRDSSNIPTSREIGLSAKVIWARQLRYRLDLSASIGDRGTYAAAVQDALAAGYVICPNHVLRRASAIIPLDAALLPNNATSL